MEKNLSNSLKSSRRNFLIAGSTLGAGLLASSTGLSTAIPEATPGARNSVRAAALTRLGTRLDHL